MSPLPDFIVESIRGWVWRKIPGREPQLAALQQQKLAAINLEPIVASAFAFEPVAVCRDLEIMKPSEVFYVNGSNHGVKLRDRLLDLIPRGWIYQNMAIIARMRISKPERI